MPPTPYPLGWDLFGDSYYSEKPAGPPPLPVYTSETLPWNLRTLKQIRAEGREPTGPTDLRHRRRTAGRLRPMCLPSLRRRRALL